MPISKKQLQGLKIVSYVVFTVRGNQKALMFVCASERESFRLMNLLKSHTIALKIRLDASKNILLELEFQGADYAIGYNTKENEADFFELTVLKNAPFKFLTTGHSEGQATFYREDLVKLEQTSFN